MKKTKTTIKKAGEKLQTRLQSQRIAKLALNSKYANGNLNNLGKRAVESLTMMMCV